MVLRWCLLCLHSSCLLCLVLSLGSTGKGLEQPPLHSPFRYLHILMRSPASLLPSRLSNPSSLNLFSRKFQGLNRFWGSSLGSLFCTCLACAGKPRAGHSACMTLMREFQTSATVNEINSTSAETSTGAQRVLRKLLFIYLN